MGSDRKRSGKKKPSGNGKTVASGSGRKVDSSKLKGGKSSKPAKGPVKRDSGVRERDKKRGRVVGIVGVKRGAKVGSGKGKGKGTVQRRGGTSRGVKGKPASQDLRKRLKKPLAKPKKRLPSKPTAKPRKRPLAPPAKKKLKSQLKKPQKVKLKGKPKGKPKAKPRAKPRTKPSKKPLKRKPLRRRRLPAPPPPPPPPPSKKKPKKPRRPISSGQVLADAQVQDYLGKFLDQVNDEIPSLELSIKTFINADGSVDGELRIGNLPDDWRDEEGTPLLMAFLSQIFRKVGILIPGVEEGRYWVSIGVRFGPQNESEIGELAELYKRHRGLFQVASYALQMDMPAGLQNAVVSIGTIIKSLQNKRGLPPAAVFVRVTWLPVSDVRPHRYEGERGQGY